MADEYKALTVVNLPFIEKRFNPGEMISRQDFDDYADAAAAAVMVNEDGDNVPSADEVIEHFIEWGSISDDPDAELHPDHRPVDPNARTLGQLVNDAQNLIDRLEAEGVEIPAKLRDLAEISERQVSSVDRGEGADSNG